MRLTKPDSTAIVTPVYFVAEQFKGDVSRKVYNCLDLAEQRESTDSFVKDNVTFRIIARRNSLGRPASLVIPEDKGDQKHAQESAAAAPPRAVFLLLNSWAVNDRLLCLDLPRDTFSAGTPSRLVHARRPGDVGGNRSWPGKK